MALEEDHPKPVPNNPSRQISIVHKPELRGFGGDSVTKPSFKVTSPEALGSFFPKSSPMCRI